MKSNKQRKRITIEYQNRETNDLFDMANPIINYWVEKINLD